MNRLLYIQKYNEAKSLYTLCKSEIDNVFHSLNNYEKEYSYSQKNIGIYWHIKKLIPCFDDFFRANDSNSTQSMITLLRMIVDNYAILYLFTNYSSKEDQQLRYYLFLLDAMKARPKLIDNFVSNLKHNHPEELYENAEKAKISDNESSSELLKIIKQNKLDTNIESSIIQTANWKFKDKKQKKQNINKYSWQDLYLIARIPRHYAYSIQNYYSSFTHGLAISLHARNDDSSYPLRITSLDLSSVIISMIIKILLTEYHTETTCLQMNKSIIGFMNNNWNNWNKYKR